jgi:hypothetical protein
MVLLLHIYECFVWPRWPFWTTAISHIAAVAAVVPLLAAVAAAALAAVLPGWQPLAAKAWVDVRSLYYSNFFTTLYRICSACLRDRSAMTAVSSVDLPI